MEIQRLDIELSELFGFLGNQALEWYWAVGDLELWLKPDAPEKLRDLLKSPRSTVLSMNGPELADLAQHTAVANWGVFLAFESQILGEISLQSEGYTGPVQHPDAILEVRAVDGGYLELVRPSS